MKVRLEWDLETEKEEYETAMLGNKYRACLEEIWVTFRSKAKHTPDAILEAHDVYEELCGIINNWGLDIV